MKKPKSKKAQAKLVYASLRDLAARVGVTHQALSKAVQKGRLTSVIYDAAGVPVVPDLDVAAGEWSALTGAKEDSGTLAEATLALTRQKALTASLENRARLCELVPAVLVDRAWGRICDEVREAILAIPTRAEQIGAVKDADSSDKMEALVREVLERLATRPQMEGAE